MHECHVNGAVAHSNIYTHTYILIYLNKLVCYYLCKSLFTNTICV